MLRNMIKLLVFDWDDVITLGSKEGYYACYRETLNELGITLDERELHIRIQRKWGQPFREELKELASSRDVGGVESCDRDCGGARHVDVRVAAGAPPHEQRPIR